MANVTLTLHKDLVKRVSENEIEVVILAEGKTYDAKETLKRAGYKFGDPSQVISRVWHKTVIVDALESEEVLENIEVTRFVQNLLNSEVEAVNAVADNTCECYQYDFDYYERVKGIVAPGTVNPNKFTYNNSGYSKLRANLQEIL